MATVSRDLRLGRRSLVMSVIAASALLTAAGGTSPPAAVEARLQAVLDSLVREARAPGATLGVVLPDGRVLGLASGEADTARHEAMTPDRLMLQGSVGKTYFGATVLQLVAEGRLALDEPVREVFGAEPWLDRIPNGGSITLRHLLGHTSGLVRYELNPRFLEELTAAPLRTFTPQERLSYLFDAEPPFAPGEGWEYSDTNYIVVAMLIEAVTGRPAYEEIRRRFLAPLALAETVPSDRPAIPGLTQGYAGAANPFGGFDAMVHDGALRVNPQFEWGGGGFASSARDLARWTHHVQTGRVFGGPLLEAFRQGRPAPLGPDATYGLGVIMMTLPAGRAWGHSGFMPGYRTEAYHFPDDGFTLALQVNASAPASLRVPPVRMISALASALSALEEGRRAPEREGRVVAAEGMPAPGAMVTATLADGRTFTVYAREDGAYRLPSEAAAAVRIEARLQGAGYGVAPDPDGVLRLASPDPTPPPGSAWLAGLPAGEDQRRYILDCTGCHITDASRTEVAGVRRDSASWHASVDRMRAMFGPGTGFPIISSWSDPGYLSGWLARSFGDVTPTSPGVAGPIGEADLTEYPVPVPQDLPHDLMVDAAGNVLVTGMFTHLMYRLDPVSGAWATTPIPVPNANPRALDLDRAGRWWLVLGAPGKVAVHDPLDGTWSIHDVGMYAHSIMVGPDGRGWVNGHFTHEPELVASVDGVSGAVSRFTVPADPAAPDLESTIPYGLRVARDGTVWGTQLRGNRLLRLSPADGAVEAWPIPLTHAGARRPDLAPDGSVWIPLYSANALARFDPRSRTFRIWEFPVAGALPYVVRVHQGDGTVWIGTGHGDLVASFDPGTERFTLYPLPTRGALVRHLDVDEARGEVWFAYGASPGVPGKVLRLRP